MNGISEGKENSEKKELTGLNYQIPNKYIN